MASFLRNIYEVPSEYMRAQAMEEQERLRQQQMGFDPRAIVEAARNPMARGIVLPIIWNPQVGPDWFPKASFSAALESARKTELAREEALGTTSRMLETINTYGNEALEFVKEHYAKEINKIGEKINNIEDPLQRHFATKEAMFELSDLFNKEIAPFYKKYLEHDHRAGILMNQGAIKNKNEYFDAIFGTTFNFKNSAEVSNLTPEEEQTIVRNISSYFSNVSKGTFNLGYNVTQMAFLGAMPFFIQRNKVDLFELVYNNLLDDQELKEIIKNNSSIAPVNVIGKLENESSQLVVNSFLTPAALLEYAKNITGDTEKAKDLISKLRQNLSNCNGEDCLSALELDYNGQKVDFRPILDSISKITGQDIIDATTYVKQGLHIPEQYDGTPSSVIRENIDFLRAGLYKMYYEDIRKKVDNDDLARKLASEYADSYVKHVEKQINKIDAHIRTIYDVSLEQNIRYSYGGGKSNVNINLRNLTMYPVESPSNFDPGKSIPRGLTIPFHTFHMSLEAGLMTTASFGYIPWVTGDGNKHYNIPKYDIPSSGDKNTTVVFGYGKDGFGLYVVPTGFSEFGFTSYYFGQGAGPIFTLIKSNKQFMESIVNGAANVASTFAAFVNTIGTQSFGKLLDPAKEDKSGVPAITTEKSRLIDGVLGNYADQIPESAKSKVSVPVFRVGFTGKPTSPYKVKYDVVAIDETWNNEFNCDKNNNAVCNTAKYLANFIPYFEQGSEDNSFYILSRNEGNEYMVVYMRKGQDGNPAIMTPLIITKDLAEKINSYLSNTTEDRKGSSELSQTKNAINNVIMKYNRLINEIENSGNQEDASLLEKVKKSQEYLLDLYSLAESKAGKTYPQLMYIIHKLSMVKLIDPDSKKEIPALDLIINNTPEGMISDITGSNESKWKFESYIKGTVLPDAMLFASLPAIIPAATISNTNLGVGGNDLISAVFAIYATPEQYMEVTSDDGRANVRMGTQKFPNNSLGFNIRSNLGFSVRYKIYNNGDITIGYGDLYAPWESYDLENENQQTQ